MEGTRILVLNSKDRLANSVSSTNCIFQFSASACTKVEPISLQMPMSSYNINSTNNYVYFFDTVARNFVITPGNYSVYDLIIALQTGFNSVSANYTVTYSDISMKITITGLINFRMMFATNTTASSAYILGFSAIDTALALSQRSNNCIDLSLPLYFNCSIREFNDNVKSTSDVDNCTFVFPNRVNGADLMVYSELTDYRQCSIVNEVNVQSLNVKFTVNNNIPLDINNNDWVMLLRLHYC